jgi:hypothetical protein
MESFNFLHMRPDSTIIPGRKNIQVLAEFGKQYGLYTFGKGPHTIELSIPPGNYSVEFMNPLTGEYEPSRDLTSDGKMLITSPAYEEDLAVRIFSVNR